MRDPILVIQPEWRHRDIVVDYCKRYIYINHLVVAKDIEFVLLEVQNVEQL